MAIKVSNSNTLSLGLFTERAVVTHVRYQMGTVVVATDQLTTSLTVPANNELSIPANGIDLRFNKGDGEDEAVKQAWKAQFDNTSSRLVVKAMSDANTEITAAGYQDVTIDGNDLTYSTETDA